MRINKFPGLVLVWDTTNADYKCVRGESKYIGKKLSEMPEKFRTNKARLSLYERIAKTKGDTKYDSYEDKNEILFVRSTGIDLLELVIFKNKHELSMADIKAHHTFMASMSHEIRNPLNGIMGMISVLKETKLDKKQQKALDVMLRSSYDLMAIVNDILDISKLDIGAIKINAIPMSIHDCVESSYAILSDKGREKNLDFRYFIDEKVPRNVVQDYTRVRQVLVNLLTNAIKFTNSGSVNTSVTVEKKSKRTYYIRFTVTDTGIGISKKDIKKLFVNFSKLDKGNKFHTGTGLGLSISKQLCELMGGDIGVKSKKGKGSSFYFILPFRSTKKDRKMADEQILKNMTVLLVDDKPANIVGLCKLLDAWGIDHRECVSGELALLSYVNNNRYRFDIGLLDICMPGMDGNELAKIIKNGENSFPLIALSSADERIHTISSYFDDHLIKPYKQRVLREKILQVMEGKKIIKKSIFECDMPNIKILIAEDMEFNREVIKEMLNALGYKNYSTVENGRELVNEIKRVMKKDAMYDIILLDIKMPIMNGIDAMRKIDKLLGKIRRPKVIAVTAMATNKQVHKYKKQIKFDEYLTKPIQDISILNNAIKKVING